MPTISPTQLLAEVNELASLARLRLSESQAEQIGRDLAAILTAMDALASVDVEDVAPMTHAANSSENQLRGDTIAESFTPQQALASAPQATTEYFVVPAVIERDE